jgi:hypothetical protein
MPSPLYDKLVKTVGAYIGDEKASGAVERRLKDCSATPDTFTAAHMKQILAGVTTAATLYVVEPDKKVELTEKLKALAA